MLSIPSPSESIAIYAGDSSSTQLLDLTRDSYCNLHGLSVVLDDTIQFNNQPRLEDNSHYDLAAATMLSAAADTQSELHLTVQSVEGIEVRAIERVARAAAIQYGEFVFAVDSYAMTIESMSNVESPASFLGAGDMSATPMLEPRLHTAPLEGMPLQAAPLHSAEPIPAQEQSDDRFAGAYILEPLHPTLPRPMGLADLVRGPVEAANCGPLDAP